MNGKMQKIDLSGKRILVTCLRDLLAVTLEYVFRMCGRTVSIEDIRITILDRGVYEKESIRIVTYKYKLKNICGTHT